MDKPKMKMPVWEPELYEPPDFSPPVFEPPVFEPEVNERSRMCPKCGVRLMRKEYEDGYAYVDVHYSCSGCDYDEWHTEDGGREID